MDVVIYDILLDTQYAGCRRQIELKKGEANSKTFRIELCKGTEPIVIDPKETIAIIKGYKEDGTVIFNSAKITDESKIEYEVGSQDTAVVGTTWYEVQLVAKDGGSYKILYSAQFKAVVKDTVVEDGKITSSDEFGLLVETITENKAWKEKKDKELDEWMKAREKGIDEKEQEHKTLISQYEKEHVDLIYDNTLVYSSTKTFTSSEGTSEPGKAFVSNEIEVDCDAIEVINNSTTMCKVMRDVYNVLDTVGPNQTKRIILKDIPKYHIEINSVIPGETSVDPTKIKINKYISVKRANLALPMNNDFMNNVGKRIGSFMASYCVEDPAFMSSITTALPKNRDFLTNTASRLPSHIASYCVEDSAFMSSMAAALPSNDNFMSAIGRRIGSFADDTLPNDSKFVSNMAKKLSPVLTKDIDFTETMASILPSHIASYCVEDPLFMSSMATTLPKNESFVETMAETLPDKLGLECQKNSTFMDCMRDGLTSRLPASPLFIEELTKVLPSKLAPELVSDVTFQNKFVGNVDLMCSIGLDANVGKAMAGNSMLSGAIASYLPEQKTFINSVGRKLAKADSFCSELVSSPQFGSAVLLNPLVSLELNKYVPKTATICGIPFTSNISPSAMARNLAPVLPENVTFVSKMAEVLPSTGTFISDIAKELPSDTTFISNMGSKIASVLPSTGAFVSDVGKKLMSDSTFISGIAGSSYFASKLVENSTFMTSAANKMASKFSTSALEILASSLASPLTSNTIFMNNIAKIASNSTFISTVTTDPLFMRGVANNFPSHMTSVTRSYLASYIEEPLATNASFMANMASLLPANGTFIKNIAKVGSNNTFVNTLLAGTSFINGVAEKMPSRLGFFGIFQTITTPNESGKEYFKFEDYSIKGKYSINSDRNKINIPRKLLSIKVRGNFSGAQSCKNCKICGEVIDENNQTVLGSFDIFRVKAGSDADGLVTETQPFNAEYILNADFSDSSLANKTLYIRFYVEYDTIAYFYNVSSYGDCSVTITEI